MTLMASSRILRQSKANIKMVLIKNFLTFWESKFEMKEKIINLLHFRRFITIYYYFLYPTTFQKDFLIACMLHQEKPQLLS